MKKTVTLFQKLKDNNEKIAMLTAYDYSTAKILNEADIDGILVGDSLAMVALGYENTYNITIDEMLIFIKAVKKTELKLLLVARCTLHPQAVTSVI